MTTREDVIKLLKEMISDETRISLDDIKDTDTFFSLGLDSISCIFLMDKLEKKLHIELNPIHFWDYPAIRSYAEFLVLEYSNEDGN
jgi:acyl carrier protein